jgi:hypothetical protein
MFDNQHQKNFGRQTINGYSVFDKKFKLLNTKQEENARCDMYDND